MPSHLRQTLNTSPYFFLLNGNRQPGFEPVYFSGEAASEICEGESYGLVIRYPDTGTDDFNRLKLFQPELCTLIKAGPLHPYDLSEEPLTEQAMPAAMVLKPVLSKAAYIRKIEALKQHIHAGDIYEVNFCMEFSAEDVTLDPLHTYQTLNAISEAPFSALVKLGHVYLMCSSPERFIRKHGNQLMSQPIKGTARRGATAEEDFQIKQALRQSLKEQTENVMIVDVVRNDLSKLAERGSVQVDELFGVYSYKQVHQMISTVSCTLKPGLSFTDIMKATFPMASMTGAPKQRACDLIRQYELTPRNLYSGALGMMQANGDFDLNVVIRTIVYDAQARRVSFHVGSAITALCDPEQEYEECLLKAAAMVKALNASLAEV